MADGILLLLSFAAGVCLGGLFFGGLWWTISKGLAAKQLALWFMGSFLFRTAVLLAGLYFVANGRWERFAVCLLGFIIARYVILRLTHNTAATRTPSVREAHHAS